ncbi:MAG: copper resistance protein CopC, partial [Acidimicrobiales bacterium]
MVAALWLVVAATPAGAHADLTATEPAAGEVLASSPNEIVLRFSEGVDPIEGGIRLVRDTGEEVGRFDIQQIEGSVLRVRLEQSLPPAGYVVAWRAVSADSHPIRGAFVFHVGQEPGGDTSALVNRLLSDQGGTPGPGALLAVGRWLSFAGVLLVVGVALLSVWTASLPTPPSARSASGGS